MNEKEAREIDKRKPPHEECGDEYEPACMECDVTNSMKMYAKGYLEAIEKAKVLEDIVKLEIKENNHDKNIDGDHVDCCWICELEKAVAQWEKEK